MTREAERPPCAARRNSARSCAKKSEAEKGNATRKLTHASLLERVRLWFSPHTPALVCSQRRDEAPAIGRLYGAAEEWAGFGRVHAGATLIWKFVRRRECQ
jgi:hypothetical protein